MNKDRVLVLGTGFLAQTFARHGYTTIGRDRFNWQSRQHSGDELGIIYSDKLDVIINTIGISDTRLCEQDHMWSTIHEINGVLPGILSGHCHIAGKKFVHISTGCLYDTRNIPQKEEAFKSAHCNYVISKWIGEIGCDKESDLIIRPRLLFDSAAPKAGKRNNLLCKLNVFNSYLSELNTVTSNDTIIEAIEALLEAKQSGVFNVGQTGEYSIYDIAQSLGMVDENTITINQEELHKSQGLYLVNNIMDLSKLQKYYQPRDAVVELKRCWEIMKENGEI